MNYEDMIKQARAAFGMQENFQQAIDIPVELIDTFIQRCISEKGYDEHSLHQACMFKLYGQVPAPNYIIVSDAEMQVLPLVIKRLEGKL